MDLHQQYQMAQAGAHWWASNAFRSKTFVEARSLWQPLMAFYRVYSLHLVLLVVMTAGVSRCRLTLSIMHLASCATWACML